MSCVPMALFIHGTASSGRIWARLLEAMEAVKESPALPDSSGGEPRAVGPHCPIFDGSILARSILAPDIPGMGDAPAPPGGSLTFDGWLDHFRALGKGQTAHLVGHSLGGAIAVHLASEPWVLSVTLIAPATRAYCGARRAGSRPGGNPGSIVFERPLGRLVADPRRLSREDAQVLREDRAKAAPLLAAGVPWPPFHRSESEYLRGKPVLLVYGEEDAVLPAAYYRELRADLESAGLSLTTSALPQCGHLPQVERPKEVASLLASFWALACSSGSR